MSRLKYPSFQQNKNRKVQSSPLSQQHHGSNWRDSRPANLLTHAQGLGVVLCSGILQYAGLCSVSFINAWDCMSADPNRLGTKLTMTIHTWAQPHYFSGYNTIAILYFAASYELFC